MYVLFNVEGTFIGYSPDAPPQANILKIEIPDHLKLSEWYWEGDFNNGKMVPILSDSPNEANEILIFEKLNQRYPLSKQLHLIVRQLYKTTKDNPEADSEFLDMAEQIIDAIDNKAQRLKYYSSFKKQYESN